MDDAGIQPLDRIYRLEENAEWRHLLDHLRLLDGFGLLFVLAPEQAGAEVCRRALQRHFAAQGHALQSVQLHLQEPRGTLGDSLLHAPAPEDAGAVWVSAPEAESATHEEPVRQLWREALAALNPRRNPLRRHLRVPLIFAGPMWLQEICREAAPDLWSIRDTIARIEPARRGFPSGGEMQRGIESTQGERIGETGDPEDTRQALAHLREKTVPESEGANLELLKTRLLHRLGRQLWQRYQWDEAEAALLEAEQIVERHHQNLEEQVEILFDLGRFLTDRGDFVRADRYLRKACEFANAHFGEEDPNTLMSRNNLAVALYDQGRYTEAEHEHRAVMAIRERVLGAEHLDTLMSRNNLANALCVQGKYAEAELEHRESLALFERVFGAEHPDTLSSRNNLANALGAQGKYQEEEKEDRSVLAIRKRVLGPEQREVFRSGFNLALNLARQNKLPEALEIAQQAENGHKQVMGENHADYKNSVRLRELIEAAIAKEKAAKKE